MKVTFMIGFPEDFVISTLKQICFCMFSVKHISGNHYAEDEWGIVCQGFFF